jgi:hypothetical protein
VAPKADRVLTAEAVEVRQMRVVAEAMVAAKAVVRAMIVNVRMSNQPAGPMIARDASSVRTHVRHQLKN